MTTQVPPRGMGVEDGAQYCGLKRSKYLELLYSGAIPSFRVGKRRLVLRDHLDAWLEKMASAGRAQ